jgi:hypothetical protein
MNAASSAGIAWTSRSNRHSQRTRRLRQFASLPSSEASCELRAQEPADCGNQDGDDDLNGFAELVGQEPFRRNDHDCESDDCSEYRAQYDHEGRVGLDAARFKACSTICDDTSTPARSVGCSPGRSSRPDQMGRTVLKLGPPSRHPRVGKEAAERLSYPAEKPVHSGRERREPKSAQEPGEPPSGGDVFEHADTCGTMHHPHACGLDELPRSLYFVLGDTRGIRPRGLIIPAQESESLRAIQPGDDPRRRATERSAAVEQ